MERLYADLLAEHAERLGDHAVRGEAWNQAVLHLARAGAKAMSAAAFPEAAHHFSRALEAMTHLPDSRRAREDRVDLLFHLHDALLPLAQYERVGDVLREAEAVACGLDGRRQGRAYSYLSHYAWVAERDKDNLRAIEYAGRSLSREPRESARWRSWRTSIWAKSPTLAATRGVPSRPSRETA
jgi:hypothetical protein